MTTEVNYCGISGGKDSAATALWLIHESGLPAETMRFTFCNTHNEHQFTYDHVALISRYVEARGCAPVVTLEPERGFFELAKWKRRFPSRKARFCTQYLKVIPSREDVQRLIWAGNEVVVHSGVRAAESVDRAKLVERGFSDMFGCVVNRPLLHRTLADVLAMHEKYGLPLNPLYSYGAQRVGCFPCINSRKSEIKLISIHFPERIDELEAQEGQFGGESNDISTFFARKTVPLRFRSKTVNTKRGPMKVATIRDVVRWSRTGKRAKEMEPYLLADFDDDPSLVCPSGAGMCE